MKKINNRHYIYLFLINLSLGLLNLSAYFTNNIFNIVVSLLSIIIFSSLSFIYLYNILNNYIDKKYELIKIRDLLIILLMFFEYFLIKNGYGLIIKYCDWSYNWDIKWKIIMSFCILCFAVILIEIIVKVHKHNNLVKEKVITDCEFQQKFLANNDLTDKIRKYYDNKNIDGAILIDGSWGSGKTYYINKYIDLFNSAENGRAVYVSLNGLKSIEEINNALFAALHPIFSSVKNSPILKVLNCATKYSVDLLDLDIESLSEIRIDIGKFDAKLIIFDDVERCQLDIPSLFGYIDNIKSSCNKIILIADEKELMGYRFLEESYHNKVITSNIYIAKAIGNSKDKEKKDESKIEDLLYESVGKKPSKHEKVRKELGEIEKALYPKSYYEVVKEKLIWNTYRFNFDINILFDSFVNNNEYAKIKEIIDNSKELITKIEERTNCSNLRTYKCALEYFSEIFEELDFESFGNKDDIIEEVLVNIFVLIIHYKHPLKDSFEDSIRINKKEYKRLISFNRFNDGLIVDFDELKSELQKTDRELTETKEKKAPEYIINLRETWAYMKDDYLTENIKSLIQAYESKQLKIDYFVLFYHYLHTYIKVYGFDSDLNLDDVKNELIRRIEASNEYVENDKYFMMSYKIYKEEDPAIQELYNALEKMNQRKKSSDIVESAMDPSRLSYESIEKISNQAMGRRAFISLFSSDELLDFIKKSDNETFGDFRSLVNRVYSFSNIKDYFEEDKESIEKLINELEKYSEKCESKTKRKLIEWFIDYLKEILSRL